MRCAPVCEVDCERRMACSVGVSVRLFKSCLWMFLWMVETCFIWMVWRRRAAPSGLRRKEGFVHFLGDGGLKLGELST